MARDTNLNQDLNSKKTASSPAHQHMQSNPLAADASLTSKQKRLNGLGMESARRAGNRFSINDQRTPDSTIFTK
jgi:hypothetical protein